MRLYWELARLSFQRQLAYRISNYAGLATNLFFGALRAAVLLALFQNRGEVSGLTVRDAVTFTALTQSILAFLLLFAVNNAMINSVTSGEVANDLLKPIPYFGYWHAREFGGSVVSLFLRGAVIMGAYALFFPITVPRSLPQGAAFALALLMAWNVSFAWRYWVNLSAFWVVNAKGVSRLAFTLSFFLCGFVFPLRLFPEAFQRFCRLTPFPSMVNTPVEIYLGVLSGPALVQALLVQLFWFGTLCIIGAITFRAGVRRLVITGG
jgi:ABC-2 type transport system permease protein